MNENEPAPTGKGMYWTGVVMSVIPSLMLLMASVMSLSKSAQALAQFGYPENGITAIGAACLVSTVLYTIPRTAVLGAILLTGYLGGAMASHLRIGSPLFTHTLFGFYLGLMVWGGLWLRDRSLRALIPFRR